MSSEERQRGVDLFNEVWRLMETREDNDRMLHAAHAMAYHWGEAPECRPENRARAEWQISRVYTVLGRAEPAIWHARRCLAHCEEAGLRDWDLAYAYEAMGRYLVAWRGSPNDSHVRLVERCLLGRYP